MARSYQNVFAAAAVLLSWFSGALSQDICLSNDCQIIDGEEVCTFYASIDIFAGHTGYYRFEGCDGIQPTLGMKQGVKYVFDQTDETNWFHPLGFAYGPDGVYRENPELEKGEKGPLSVVDCDADNSTADPFCDFPQYLLNGEELCSDPDDCFEDFGLDEYEGVHFSGGRGDWLDAGNFTVEVTINDPDTKEIFYFCHIHEDMSARIKILNASTNEPLEEADITPIPYEYDVNDEFDTECGTSNVSIHSDISSVCPDMTFLCGTGDSTFDICMNAIDCQMHVEMRVDRTGQDPVTTFMHQMIAHHRNAVNMAKILLKLNPPELACGTNYDGRRLQDCADTGEDGGQPAEDLLWTIINGQNQQITFMKSWLADNGRDAFANCLHETDDSLATEVIIGAAVGAVGVFALAGALLVAFRFRSQVRTMEADSGEAKLDAKPE